METFLDGGLFELLIGLAFLYIINFIFLKKYLLIAYSAISIASPVLAIFIGKSEIFYFLISLSIINSILLVIILWTVRKRNKDQPLFNVERYKKRMFNLFKKGKRLKKEFKN